MNPDHSATAQLEQRLRSATKRLHELSSVVGAAKQVKAYDGDRRKNALAKYVVKYLYGSNSRSAAEDQARADSRYEMELELLAGQYADAEKSIAQWEAEYASFEAARSLLSMARETMKTLDG